MAGSQPGSVEVAHPDSTVVVHPHQAFSGRSSATSGDATMAGVPPTGFPNTSSLEVFRRNHRRRRGRLLLLDQALDDGGAVRRRGWACRLARAGSVHTHQRKTGLDARSHGVSGTEPAAVQSCPSGLSRSVASCLTPTGPRVSSRTWTRRWTRLGRPGTSGRSARSSRAGGGWRSLVSTVAGGGRRPRRGCAVVLSPSGRVNR
jgi:hypothetical protein